MSESSYNKGKGLKEVLRVRMRLKSSVNGFLLEIV